MCDGRQISAGGGGPTFAYVRVHCRRKVEVRRRIYPDDAEVSGVIESVLNSQHILNIPWGNLVAQRSLLAWGWEMLGIPSAIVR